MSYLLVLSVFLLFCSIILCMIWYLHIDSENIREPVGRHAFSTFEAGTFLLFICFLMKLAGFELGW